MGCFVYGPVKLAGKLNEEQRETALYLLEDTGLAISGGEKKFLNGESVVVHGDWSRWHYETEEGILALSGALEECDIEVCEDDEYWAYHLNDDGEVYRTWGRVMYYDDLTQNYIDKEELRKVLDLNAGLFPEDKTAAFKALINDIQSLIDGSYEDKTLDAEEMEEDEFLEDFEEER